VSSLIAVRQREEPFATGLHDVVAASAGIVWIVASMTALPALGATLAFLAYAWLLFAGDVVRPGRGLVHSSAIVLLLAALKWVVIDNLADRISAAHYVPVLNPVMGMGLLITISLAAVIWIRRRTFLALAKMDSADNADQSRLLLFTAGFALVFMTIGFTFEINRIVEQVRATRVLAWPPDQARHLAWTMLWCASSCALIGLARFLEPDESRRRQTMKRLAILPIALAIKFLVVDALGFRVVAQPANVLAFANVQTLAAMFVLGGLALAWFVDGPQEPGTTSPFRGFVAFLVIALLFLTGTLEIDRWAAHQTFGFPWFVRQVGFSIFWSVFAVACVAAGFSTRVAALRYCGLTLLAFTLVKVVAVDLSQISTGYRVLSFMGLGLLLLGTSVLYGKLSPRLLALMNEESVT
jgi:hypothetical protein